MCTEEIVGKRTEHNNGKEMLVPYKSLLLKGSLRQSYTRGKVKWSKTTLMVVVQLVFYLSSSRFSLKIRDIKLTD